MVDEHRDQESKMEREKVKDGDVEKHSLNVATVGSNALIDLNDGDRLSFARLHPNATMKIGNIRCSVAPLINSHYGTTFELQRGPKGHFLAPVPREKKQQEQNPFEPESQNDDISASEQRDNRNLVDDNSAQKLSADDIQRMRLDCASGKEIVDALIANSATFHSKTAYSQEKYKRKKQKKYAPRFVLRRPSARRICEAYFVKTPQRIGFMRMDTLSMMLSLANVGAHAEVLVMDLVGGLLTGAVAERLGGYGSVCSVYASHKPPSVDIVSLLNLSNSTVGKVFKSSVWELSDAIKRAKDGVSRSFPSNEACKEAQNTDKLDKNGVNLNEHNKQENNDTEDSKNVAMGISDTSLVADKTEIMLDDNDGDESLGEIMKDSPAANSVPAGVKAIRPGRKPSPVDIIRWAKHGFTSLIIGAPEMEPLSAVQSLLPILSSSSPFVIYHPYLQPLSECMHELQRSKVAVALEIIEPWLREYQVLPSRTHPHMQMSATGGYILSGIKIASSEGLS